MTDDPRIQYPEAEKKEGVSSILSVPIVLDSRRMGCLRVCTAGPWEFTLNFVPGEWAGWRRKTPYGRIALLELSHKKPPLSHMVAFPGYLVSRRTDSPLPI